MFLRKVVRLTQSLRLAILHQTPLASPSLTRRCLKRWPWQKLDIHILKVQSALWSNTYLNYWDERLRMNNAVSLVNSIHWRLFLSMDLTVQMFDVVSFWAFLHGALSISTHLTSYWTSTLTSASVNSFFLSLVSVHLAYFLGWRPSPTVSLVLFSSEKDHSIFTSQLFLLPGVWEGKLGLWEWRRPEKAPAWASTLFDSMVSL